MKKSYYQSSLCILLLLITYKISIAQSWAQTQKIVASDRAENDHFGNVAISGDYAIIGANAEDEDVAGGNTLVRAGAAYI